MELETTLEEIVKTSTTQQQAIRRLILELGYTRAEVAKALGIRYQIVYRATAVKHGGVPKADRVAIEEAIRRERQAKLAAEMEEVEE
jgi:hypothetical protein